jgi:hypothetical protein
MEWNDALAVVDSMSNGLFLQIIHTKSKAATDFYEKGGEVQGEVWELIWGKQNWCIISPDEG